MSTTTTIEEQARAYLYENIKPGFIQGCEDECKRHLAEYNKAWGHRNRDDALAAVYVSYKDKEEVFTKLVEMAGMNAEEKQLALYDLLADVMFHMTNAAHKIDGT